MDWLNLTVLPLIARTFLVALFPFSALDKIVYWKDALKQESSSLIPGGAMLTVMAILIELLAPVCIIAGWHLRIAASGLAIFCLATAFLYHPFWKFADFWASGYSKGREHFWNFLKNFGLIGGLLLLVLAPVAKPAMTTTQRQMSWNLPAQSPLPASTTSGYGPDNVSMNCATRQTRSIS